MSMPYRFLYREEYRLKTDRHITISKSDILKAVVPILQTDDIQLNYFVIADAWSKLGSWLTEFNKKSYQTRSDSKIYRRDTLEPFAEYLEGTPYKNQHVVLSARTVRDLSEGAEYFRKAAENLIEPEKRRASLLKRFNYNLPAPKSEPIPEPPPGYSFAMVRMAFRGAAMTLGEYRTALNRGNQPLGLLEYKPFST